MGRPRKIAVETIEEIKEDIDQIEKTDVIEEKIFDGSGVEFVSFGSDLFDLIAGGGAPWGKIINIIGDNSSGKTALASELISVAHKTYKDDLMWHYDDAEAGYAFDSKAIWGIDIVAPDDDCSETLEDFEMNFNKKLDKLPSGKKLIYVLDSFDSLTTLEEIKYNEEKCKAIEKGTKIPGSYGQSKAKGASSFFRSLKRKIKDKGCLLIIISQVRENIGVSFGARYTRMGGKALDFYSSQIFWLAVAEKYKSVNRITGIAIKIKNSKNKVGKPFREGIIDLLFDYGIDNVSSNLKFLYDLKTPEGKDKEKIDKMDFEWKGEYFSFRKLIRHIEKNNQEEDLKYAVQEKWKEIENKTDTASGRKQKY